MREYQFGEHADCSVCGRRIELQSVFMGTVVFDDHKAHAAARKKWIAKRLCGDHAGEGFFGVRWKLIDVETLERERQERIRSDEFQLEYLERSAQQTRTTLESLRTADRPDKVPDRNSGSSMSFSW